jgi:hypothetical protein
MMTDKLNQAAAAVTEWNAKLFKLREDIAKAEAVLAESAKRRADHALEAALGGHDAKQRLEQVLADDRRAERDLEDMRMALPLATSKLKEAEATHRVAESEFRKVEVNRLARERVATAAAVDQAFSDFSKAWATFSDLGQELLGLASQDQNANALFLSETISGEARLAASLPAAPFLAIRERFNFMPISTSKSLAAAEAAYWRLPTDEAAAA